ncbi:MAG: acetate--CoA ligase family protein [Nitrospinota bacterium]|nr:acetate--CoA ligase family protein [Nitrospinota bacterium]
MSKLLLNEIEKEILHPAITGKKVDLHPFFAPKSVAIIGASPRKGNLGKYIAQNLLHQKYDGTVITVHPSGQAVANCPVVKDIHSLPKTVDLAVVAVSASKVLPLLQPLANQGIHHLIIISGGFSETGEAGNILQKQIQDESLRLGIHIIGPNGMGVFSAPDRFNSFFLKPEEMILPQPGSVAFISQSGAFLMQMLNHLGKRRVGVHRAVNFGNRIDIGECELLEEFARDPEVRVIGLYLESVQDGPRFMDTARSVASRKPVVILKGGKAERGRQAALAHSASLAGSYAIFRAACEQTGMIEVNGLEQMVDALQIFSRQPQARSNRILVVSNGGGMGVLLTDLCEQAGLRVPEPSQKNQFVLKGLYPSYYSFRNPIDLTGSGTNEQCVSIVEYLLMTGEYDALLLVLLPGTEGITSDIGPMLKSRLPKNLPVSVGVYGSLYDELNSVLHESGIPVFPTGERAAYGLELLVRQSRWIKNGSSFKEESYPSFDETPTQNWLRSFATTPHEMQIKNLLDRCNIPVPKHFHILSKKDIYWAAEGIGFPLTLKVVAPDIKHKTEMKGIRLNVTDEKSLILEWEALNTDWPGQIWAEQQMPAGLDLMVGAHRDPQFGPVLLFGTGGSYVELYQDIARWVLPVTDEEIFTGIEKTKVWDIIQGFRGAPKLDYKMLLAFLKWVEHWMISEPNILSLDFNPVRLYEKDLVVLDAKITQVPLEWKGVRTCTPNT